MSGISTEKKGHKKNPVLQGPRPIYTSIQRIENSITKLPSTHGFVKYLLFAIFVSDPLKNTQNNTDLAKGFSIYYHYFSSSAEVTTILNLKFIIIINILKCLSYMKIGSSVS